MAPDAQRCSRDEDEYSVFFRDLTTYLKETFDLPYDADAVNSRIATFLAGTDQIALATPDTEPSSPTYISTTIAAKTSDPVWELLVKPISESDFNQDCFADTHHSTLPRNYDETETDVDDPVLSIDNDEDGSAHYSFKCDDERPDPLLSFNRGWPVLALPPRPSPFNSAEYCIYGAECRVRKYAYDPRFEAEPDPGICIDRQQIDINQRLIPSDIVLYKVLTIWPHPRRQLASLRPALKLASGYLNLIRSKEDEDFDGSVLHQQLSGFTFTWETRPIVDIILALELEGHTALSLDLAASDLAERERPVKLKAARKYNGNLRKFSWASYQLLGRPDSGPNVSCDDSCSLYTAPPFCFGYVIRDDFLLNDSQVYSGESRRV